MPKRRYTDEQLKIAVASSRSYAQALKKLGLKPAGGNYKLIHARVHELEIATTHFYGKGWNKAEQFRPPRTPRPLVEVLVQKSTYANTHKLKQRLYREGLKQEICEICGIIDWHGKPISFHLDHINGDHFDNRLSNLRVVCPNCHAQTATYCKKKADRSVKGA